MKYLGQLALCAPLSITALLTAYNLIVSQTATLTVRLVALALGYFILKANLTLIQWHLFARRAQALGCGDVATLPHKDPILGLDAFISTLHALNSFKLMSFYHARFGVAQTHRSILLGRRVLMTNEVENIKTILGTHMEDWPIDGPRLYATLPVVGPRSIFASNGQVWHDARAMIRPSFVRDQVADLQCFERHIANLLAAVPTNGDTFDLQEMLQRMTMDSSTDFMLGYSTNSLVSASPEARQFLVDFEYASGEASKRARLGPILYYVPHPKLKASIGRLRAYIRFYLQKVVADRRERGAPEGRGYVFLDELLKLDIPEEHVVDHILSIVVAGRDTLASSLSAVFYLLARAPDVVKKLRREIDDVGLENPSWEQLRQMKYLNNVIKEGLRLFPPVSTNSRTSNKDTLLPRGGGPDGSQPILVPKGTPVRWSLYSLHRRKDVYGEDAEEFRPERWDSNLRVGWEYIPFHGGPRICLGQQFALTQMSYTVYKFFRKFQTIEAREAGDPLLRTSLTLSFAHGCLVSVGL